MSELTQRIEEVLADRHTPEARALYEILLKYIDRRAHSVWRRRYRDVLTASEVEEVVAEAMTRLMLGSLVRFRGETLASLYAFVRTITDRTLKESVHRRLRERRAREAILDQRTENRSVPPLYEVEVHEVPLSKDDQDYLEQLMGAGSLAALARQRGQSRAAVTRMVQRIRSRIEAMPADSQLAIEAWLRSGIAAASAP